MISKGKLVVVLNSSSPSSEVTMLHQGAHTSVSFFCDNILIPGGDLRMINEGNGRSETYTQGSRVMLVQTSAKRKALIALRYAEQYR